jgi:hypothetical protein
MQDESFPDDKVQTNSVIKRDVHWFRVLTKSVTLPIKVVIIKVSNESFFIQYYFCHCVSNEDPRQNEYCNSTASSDASVASASYFYEFNALIDINCHLNRKPCIIFCK